GYCKALPQAHERLVPCRRVDVRCNYERFVGGSYERAGQVDGLRGRDAMPRKKTTECARLTLLPGADFSPQPRRRARQSAAGALRQHESPFVFVMGAAQQVAAFVQHPQAILIERLKPLETIEEMLAKIVDY